MSEYSMSHLRRVTPRYRRLKLATAGVLTAGALGVTAFLASPAFADEETWQAASSDNEADAVNTAKSNAQAVCSQLGYNETYFITVDSGVNGTTDTGAVQYSAIVRAECSLD